MEATLDKTVYRVEGWGVNHDNPATHLATMREWADWGKSKKLPAVCDAMKITSYCGVTCDASFARDSFTRDHKDILKVTSVRETLSSHLTWTHLDITQGGRHGCE